jgi:hypothetical protein
MTGKEIENMKKALSLALALILILSLAACGQQAAKPKAPVAEEVTGVTVPDFSVTVNGVAVDQAAMAAYPLYSVQATSTNNAGTETSTTYVGFALGDVLAATGLNEAYVWLEATADDGYSVNMVGDAVAAPTTLLAITKDGEAFSAAPWFAPCASAVSGDYLKGCVSILVNTVEGAPEISQPPAEEISEAAETGGLPEILDRTDKVEFAPFSFLVNGTAVTNDTLAGLSIYKITVTTTNKSGEASEATYTGYRLSDVLTACGLDAPAAVTVRANDGYETALATELIGSEYTLVAIEKDKATGEDGTIWLAPCSEGTASSYAKLVVELIAE